MWAPVPVCPAKMLWWCIRSTTLLNMSSPCAEPPPMGMPLSLAAFSLHRVGSPPHGGSASSESSDGAVSLPSLSGVSASLSNQVRRGASCAQCRRLVQVPRREIFLVLQPDRRCRSSAWRFGLRAELSQRAFHRLVC